MGPRAHRYHRNGGRTSLPEPVEGGYEGDDTPGSAKLGIHHAHSAVIAPRCRRLPPGSGGLEQGISTVAASS